MSNKKRAKLQKRMATYRQQMHSYAQQIEKYEAQWKAFDDRESDEAVLVHQQWQVILNKKDALEEKIDDLIDACPELEHYHPELEDAPSESEEVVQAPKSEPSSEEHEGGPDFSELHINPPSDADLLSNLIDELDDEGQATTYRLLLNVSKNTELKAAGLDETQVDTQLERIDIQESLDRATPPLYSERTHIDADTAMEVEEDIDEHYEDDFEEEDAQEVEEDLDSGGNDKHR